MNRQSTDNQPKFSPLMEDKAIEYLNSKGRTSISGLAKHLGVSRQAVYDWMKRRISFLHLANQTDTRTNKYDL